MPATLWQNIRRVEVNMADDWKTALAKGLTESAPSLLIILGIVCLLLGLAGGVTYRQWLPITEAWARILAIVVGVSMVGLGYRAKHTVLPNPEDFGIEITSPNKGNTVDEIFNVTMTLEKSLPEGYALQVVRIYSDNRFAPTGGEAEKSERQMRTWTAMGCSLSRKPPTYIRLYLVGPDARALFSYYREATKVHKQAMEMLRNYKVEAEYLPAIGSRTNDMIPCSDTIILNRKS